MKTNFVPLCLLAVELFAPMVGLKAQGTIYISNLGANSLGTVAIANNAWLAQSFGTGPNSQGYSLNNIQLSLTPASGTPSGFSVFLYGGNGAYPSNSLASLTGPSNPSQGGIVTFSDSSLALLPSTRYWIVLTAQSTLSSGAYSSSIASFFTYTASDNWWMDRYYAKSLDGLNWVDNNVGFNLQFAVNATAIPEPSSLALYLCGSLLIAGKLWRRSERNNRKRCSSDPLPERPGTW